MKKVWIILYNVLVIPVFFIGIQIAGLINSKIRTGIRGRKRLFEDLIVNATSLNKSKKLIWFHSSSLGEFEQAKPIIKELKEKLNINVLVTFFSPSGYENSKKYPYADLVSYIPFDSASNAKKFIQIIKPDLAVMMRYDIWPNHIWEMKKASVPCYLVDATMKQHTARKLPLIKNFHKHLYSDITKILTVTENDVDGFKFFNCSGSQLKAVGDTRFDRVYQRSSSAREKKLIRDEILKDKKVFVAGSTWEQDEEVILTAFKKLACFDKNAMLIIAPHEPTLLHLEKIENEFSGEPDFYRTGRLDTIRFSFLNDYKNERVIIVDSIGILLTLYIYADIAFVGGSFKQNIHNVLEAAVYGVPVLFGPKIDNSQESQQLAERGGGIIIKNKNQAYRQLRTLFLNDELRKKKGKISFDYVQENLGASEKILSEIYKIL